MPTFFLLMKIKLTQSQKHLLLEYQKRAYSFDWDDNILFMPTQIYLEKKVKGEWVPVSISTEEFREVRNLIGKEFRYPNNNLTQAFKDFRDYDAFIRDTKESLRKKSFGPSFNKFIEALEYGNDFSIITARGNPPQAIKEGIKIIIDTIFTDEQKEKMEQAALTIQKHAFAAACGISAYITGLTVDVTTLAFTPPGAEEPITMSSCGALILPDVEYMKETNVERYQLYSEILGVTLSNAMFLDSEWANVAAFDHQLFEG